MSRVDCMTLRYSCGHSLGLFIVQRSSRHSVLGREIFFFVIILDENSDGNLQKPRGSTETRQEKKRTKSPHSQISKKTAGGDQNLERRNLERPIFQNFKITNIKITKNELFDNIIFEFNFL